ncbi:MAG: transposase [bacterium]
MSRPRQIVPGTTVLVTRRCTQRQFLLRPSRRVSQVFLYCLAHAAAEYGIMVHAFTVLSNHFHLVLTDPHGRLPEFMHWLDGYVARALNAHHGRWENFWAPGSYSHVVLETPDDVLDKMVYTLVNPVAAGLVPRAAKWPGLTSVKHHIGDTITIERPEIFFRPDGPMPVDAELELIRPPGFEKTTDGKFEELLLEQLARKEDEVRTRFKLEGRRFAGVHAIRKIKPFDSPASREPRRRLNPRIACKDTGLRIAAIERLKAFQNDYREAFRKWKAGNRRVVFPYGTYQLRVQAAVRCRDP